LPVPGGGGADSWQRARGEGQQQQEVAGEGGETIHMERESEKNADNYSLLEQFRTTKIKPGLLVFMNVLCLKVA
jgi:hypothetical protein